MQEKRKQYTMPTCRRLGTIQELTHNGGAPNRDLPMGPTNDAYPNS